MQAEWKADVPTLDLLNRMVSDPLPLDLRSGRVEPFFQRDIYFDSADWTLRRRGVSCRFRIGVDDRRILTLRTGDRWEDGALFAPPQRFEAEVPELEGEQALAGTSDPARRLRALIEPGQLLPRIQFETERRVRRSKPAWFFRARHEILYDVVTVRSHHLAQKFQELKLRQVVNGRPALDRLAQAFQQRYGLRTLLVGKQERAEKLLRELEADGLADVTRRGREVAVIVLQAGAVAMIVESDSLTLPIRRGSGEEGCRDVLRASFGSADGQVRLLGTAPAGLTRPLLEVWEVRRAAGAPDSTAAGQLQWLPVEEVLAAAGSPGLRDPRTLAALTVAARSEAFTGAAPAVQAPARATERRIRLSDVALRPPVADLNRLGPEHFLNSDLSLLHFNARVLALAEDVSVPLLARLRFLAIVSANLDEFFMVRVTTLKRAVAEGAIGPGDDGLAAEEALHVIGIRVRALLERQARCFADACRPALAAHDVRIFSWTELSQAHQERLGRYFMEEIFPFISPQAMTRAPGHPFPLIPNLRLSLAVLVRDLGGGPTHFAYVKVPDDRPRFVPLEDGSGFVALEEIIRANLRPVYSGRIVDAAYAFRVTRGADLELDEQHASSLMQIIEEETKRRPYGAAVRVEVERDMPQAVRELLLRELQFEDTAPAGSLGPSDLYVAPGLVDFAGLRDLARLPLPALDYPPHRGASPIEPARSIFTVLTERDVLVHHPYDDFEATVQRFVLEAADDPDVVAIKQTLYRAGGRSEIVDALVRAAGRGKEVFVFVELKARFDEERNIEWARKLEQAGIRVVYGLVELKTHAKTALVVRREAGGIRRYVHVGTGNYNAATAATYTDLGLLTADPDLGADLNDLFNELSGSSRPPQTAFRRILVSPTFLTKRLLELIAREADHARAGRDARIRAKINGLADSEIIEALYRASQAGVDIALVVRGVCTLRPGVVGLSERIRVTSVMGRFLEHGRIYHFANGGEPEYYIGSADWRPRNLRQRVEVVAPVLDPGSRAKLDGILDLQLADPTAWDLESDGTYRRRAPESGADRRTSQERLLALTSAIT
ncbi:MAG TPA: polyphosphate kinase 1 [Gemmatimonadales bacterium]|nr:polyphosphate kinase 1 [Gemmatimonadales bacterium]